MLKMLECSVRILTFDWLVNSRLQREVWGRKKNLSALFISVKAVTAENFPT